MLLRSLLIPVSLALTLSTTTAWAAETFRLVSPDGTVYYTNTPTDPSYRRIAIQSGTSAGWLRLPAGEVGTDYLRHVKDAAERYGVPEKLVNAVIKVESGFNARAVSSKGARGLMQLMPDTASLLGVRDSFDPSENINGGVRHLRRLIERFGNNIPLALAAYNAGEQAVTSYRGIPPFPETQGYVTRVMRLFNDGGDSRDAASGAVSRSWPTYRVTESDGTVVYTNIPPRARH